MNINITTPSIIKTICMYCHFKLNLDENIYKTVNIVQLCDNCIKLYTGNWDNVNGLTLGDLFYTIEDSKCRITIHNTNIFIVIEIYKNTNVNRLSFTIPIDNHLNPYFFEEEYCN